jgi:hypothetical protein
MTSNDLLGELQVLEMGESQINGATAVKYNYLTLRPSPADQSMGNSAGDGRDVETYATSAIGQAAR